MQGELHGPWRGALRGCGLLLLTLCLFLAVRPAAAAPRVYEDLLDIHFVDRDSGWASGRWGTVLRTGDGGRNWARQPTGVDVTLSGIHFVDAANGWAVGDQGTILHTRDGGRTWARQKSPVKLFLMRVHFSTPQQGWIVGERTHILHTRDGGATWRVQFAGPDFILKSVSFADERTGWAVGEYGYIYKTADGGASWVQQAGHYGMSERTGDIEGGAFLFDVHAVNDRTVWAVGIDGYVTRSDDGGATWAEVATGAPRTPLCGVAASGAELAIAGNGVLLHSRDGGATWARTAAQPKADYGWLYRVARRPGGFAAAGWQGAVYLRDAGEPAWRRVTP